mgnify:CR=1 FL=1
MSPYTQTKSFGSRKLCTKWNSRECVHIERDCMHIERDIFFSSGSWPFKSGDPISNKHFCSFYMSEW